MNPKTFKSERVSKTAVIQLQAGIEQVFPLFGPLEEKKWCEGWEPSVLFPPTDQPEEGMVFITPSHGGHESEFAWIISKFQPDNFFIEYIVSTANRYWVVAVRCTGISTSLTSASITYTYTGLNSLGNEINARAIGRMFRSNLKDWEDALNHYLTTGSMLRRR